MIFLTDTDTDIRIPIPLYWSITTSNTHRDGINVGFDTIVYEQNVIHKLTDIFFWYSYILYLRLPKSCALLISILQS